MTYEVTNIKYDTDGEKVKLPDTLFIDLPEDTQPDEVEDLLCDEISNITGFCHFGFTFTPKV